MGGPIHERLVVAKVPSVLAGALGAPTRDLQLIHQAVVGDATRGGDLVVKALGRTFVLECKATTSAATVAWAARRAVDLARRLGKNAVPLVAVPFMGEVGRRECEAAGAGWIDLSGNARIVAPGLRIIVDGRPNAFRSAGRPSSPFAPKSARVVRLLL